ncbi:MAG TPA: putative peptidoglycan glycosyltransferase FtsW [Clostridia bacterium]|nr:putative peptidoglycan glycosyltransferase FtsW [Clostridia bacterium]
MGQSRSSRLPQQRKKKTFAGLFAKSDFDVLFLIIVMTLLTIGIVMMFSASYVSAKYSSITGHDALFYLKRQVRSAVLGIVIMLVIANIDYKLYKKRWVAFTILGVCLVALIYVLINPMTIEGKESFKRWLKIPGFGQFQPSEIAKLGLIMFCAWGLGRNKKRKNTPHQWVDTLPYVAVTAVFCVLVMLENHLSGTILVFCIGLCMIFLGGSIKMKYYFIAGIALVAIAAFIILERDFLPSYIQDRLSSWLDPDSGAASSRWQINQSLYAIGSGGLFGVGLGNSKQKHLYLPEPQNDFIFAVVCEELGFFRALLIIILFVLLVWRGFVIAMRSKDRYGSLLVMGIIFKVGLQTALNICVVTGVLPNTGISLPFFSYGGTALMILLLEMGLVLSVSRYSKLR